MAGCAMVRFGKVRYVMLWQVRFGKARRVTVRHGLAWIGKAGEAGSVGVR